MLGLAPLEPEKLPDAPIVRGDVGVEHIARRVPTLLILREIVQDHVGVVQSPWGAFFEPVAIVPASKQFDPVFLLFPQTTKQRLHFIFPEAHEVVQDRAAAEVRADVEARGQAVERHGRDPGHEDALHRALSGSGFDGFVELAHIARARHHLLKITSKPYLSGSN